MPQAVTPPGHLHQLGVVQEPIQNRRGAGASPSSLPQSSRGRFDVIIVDRVSYRRITTSKRHSPERLGNCFMPMSSMINNSGFRYLFKILFSWPSTSSWRKSRTKSKIDR